MKDDKLEIAKTKQETIEITLVREVMKKIEINEKGERRIVESKRPDKLPAFTRDDITGLRNLLNRFDTTKHQVREWKPWTAIKKKLYTCYLENKEKIELTKEEFDFLKKYLEGFPNTEGKTMPLNDFEVVTMMAILDQMR